MKLVELDPVWVIQGEGRHGMGLGFICPHCKQGAIEDEERLFIGFNNPIDGGVPFKERPLWTRIGEDFNTLSISPSIDAGIDHWHGYITGGEIIFC